MGFSRHWPAYHRICIVVRVHFWVRSWRNTDFDLRARAVFFAFIDSVYVRKDMGRLNIQ